MKAIFAVPLGAMIVAGSLSAYAGTTQRAADPPPNVAAMVSTPYTLPYGGSEAMPAFDYRNEVPVLADTGASSMRGAVIPSAAADPAPGASIDPPGSGGSQAMPTFNPRNAVPVTANVGPGSASSVALQNGPASLLNRSGGGR